MLSDDVMWILEHLNVISVDPLTSVSEHRGVWDSLDFFDIIDGGIARCMIERIYSARRGIDCTITWYTDEEIARARTVAGVDL